MAGCKTPTFGTVSVTFCTKMPWTPFQGLLGAGATMILIAIIAAIYVELRAIKEGASPELLANIFA